MKMASNVKMTSNIKTTWNRKTTPTMKMISNMKTTNSNMKMTFNMRRTLNMKRTSIRASQAKFTKPNLPNHVYQTEQNIPNLPKQQKQSTKLIHIPNWQIQTKLVNQGTQKSNQSQTSLNLPWAWHSSAPACLSCYWSNFDQTVLAQFFGGLNFGGPKRFLTKFLLT